MTIRKPLSSLKNTQNITQTFVPLQKSLPQQNNRKRKPLTTKNTNIPKNLNVNVKKTNNNHNNKKNHKSKTTKNNKNNNLKNRKIQNLQKKVTLLENKIQKLHQQSFNDTNFICELEDHIQTLENKNEKLNNDLNEIKQYLGNNWKSSLCEFTLLDDLRKIDENSPLKTNQKDLQLQNLPCRSKKKKNKKTKETKTYLSYPATKDDKEYLKVIPFCLTDLNYLISQPRLQEKQISFSFLLTDEQSNFLYGFCCRVIKKIKNGIAKKEETQQAQEKDKKIINGVGYEIVCLVFLSKEPLFSLFSNILGLLEMRSRIVKAAVIKFLKCLWICPIPERGQKFFLKVPQIKPWFPQTNFQFTLPTTPLGDYESINLFALLDPEKILLLFASILFEKRIIFSSTNLQILTNSLQTATALLHPFEWQFVKIPILPLELLDTTTAPFPYIVGIHSSLLNELSTDYIGEVIFCDLDENRVEGTQEFKSLIPTETKQIIKVIKQQLSKWKIKLELFQQKTKRVSEMSRFEKRSFTSKIRPMKGNKQRTFRPFFDFFSQNKPTINPEKSKVMNNQNKDNFSDFVLIDSYPNKPMNVNKRANSETDLNNKMKKILEPKQEKSRAMKKTKKIQSEPILNNIRNKQSSQGNKTTNGISNKLKMEKKTNGNNINRNFTLLEMLQEPDQEQEQEQNENQNMKVKGQMEEVGGEVRMEEKQQQKIKEAKIEKKKIALVMDQQRHLKTKPNQKLNLNLKGGEKKRNGKDKIQEKQKKQKTGSLQENKTSNSTLHKLKMEKKTNGKMNQNNILKEPDQDQDQEHGQNGNLKRVRNLKKNVGDGEKRRINNAKQNIGGTKIEKNKIKFGNNTQKNKQKILENNSYQKINTKKIAQQHDKKIETKQFERGTETPTKNNFHKDQKNTQKNIFTKKNNPLSSNIKELIKESRIKPKFQSKKTLSIFQKFEKLSQIGNNNNQNFNLKKKSYTNNQKNGQNKIKKKSFNLHTNTKYYMKK
ncbi:denn domain-containing [Anaeramoeba flamelloides]|uniref:Denn domain-containing n=1 Tax=Anaeramoeba flamelloides TaxID=1746091 RepID=A0ABQ8Y0Q7_9EUKA|nr:denn domain-containing [Anaeramoeba flamelloides]